MRLLERSVIMAALVLCTGCATPLVSPVDYAPEPIRPTAAERLLRMGSGDAAEVSDVDAARAAWRPDDAWRSLALAEAALLSLERAATREDRTALALESCVASWDALRLSAEGSEAAPPAAARYNRALEEFLRSLDALPRPLEEPAPQWWSESAPSPRVTVASWVAIPPVSTILHVVPGETITVELGALPRMGWPDNRVDELELASDYEVNEKKKMPRAARPGAVGVPMFATRKPAAMGPEKQHSREEAFYPPGVTAPLTATLTPGSNGTLELRYESPYRRERVELGSQAHPLAADLFTPLAVFLQRVSLASKGVLWFLRPQGARAATGLYSLEPRMPKKTPVVFVHGLASSPFTWLPTHRALLAVPDIARRYQFFYFLYPSQEPFVEGGAHLRHWLDLYERDLAGRSPQAEDLILIGHSMGGLVSVLQTVDLEYRTEYDFLARKSHVFEPNSRVPLVITLATPFRGSGLASKLGRGLASLLTGEVTTSIDFLSPESMTFQSLRDAMAVRQASNGRRTVYHRILGNLPCRGGDEVVPLASARFSPVDPRGTQLEVEASHAEVQGHGESIQRIIEILSAHRPAGAPE